MAEVLPWAAPPEVVEWWAGSAEQRLEMAVRARAQGLAERRPAARIRAEPAQLPEARRKAERVRPAAAQAVRVKVARA